MGIYVQRKEGKVRVTPQRAGEGSEAKGGASGRVCAVEQNDGNEEITSCSVDKQHHGKRD